MIPQALGGRRLSLDGATLKYIAAVTMFIDHITCGLLEAGLGADGHSLMYSIPYGPLLDDIGRTIGRTAFPIFLFFVVEGYLHTRSRSKYVLLMLVFGTISNYPFKRLFYPRSSSPHTGTMFTLALGVLAVWGIDMLSEFLKVDRNILPERHPHKLEGEPGTPGIEENQAVTAPGSKTDIARRAVLIAGGMVFTAACSFTARKLGSDYSYGGVIAVVILYVFYRYRLVSILIAWTWLTYYNGNEMMAVIGFALLLCYNGERGRQNKYFFYVFYPLHLFLLVLLREALPFVS